MTVTSEDKAKKPKNYLSNVWSDNLFRVFFFILAFKLSLFTFIIDLNIESFCPAFGAILMSMVCSTILSKKANRFAYLFVLDSLCSLLFFSHSLYLKYFGDFASFYQLTYMSQLTAVSGTVTSMLGIELLFGVDLIFLPLIFFGKRIAGGSKASGKARTLLIAALIGILFNIGPLTLYRRSSDHFESILYRRDFVQQMGIVNYQVADAYYFFSSAIGRAIVADDDIQAVEEWRRKRSKEIAENSFTGIGKGMNVIFLQVESLQNFVIGRSYKGIEIAPNLNRVVEQGIYFPKIFDQTAAGNSSDATYLVNTSLYPSRRSAASFLYPHNRFDSLPKILKKHHYESAAMEAFISSFWNNAVFDKTLGFNHQFYENDYQMTEMIGWGLSDKAFFLQSLDKIEKLNTPFYALLRTLSTHSPFIDITGDIDPFPLGDLDGQEIGYYIRAMHYIDSIIGDFIGGLSSAGLNGNTIVIIYGDHRARISMEGLRQLGVTEDEEMRKIPLILVIPGIQDGIKIDRTGGLIDVAPTICNILGIDIRGGFFMGHDLLSDGSGYVIFRDGSFVGDNEVMNETRAGEELKLSDLILEKDMIPLIGGNDKVTP